MDHRHICTAAMVSHHDLLTAHEALEEGPATVTMRMVLLRHIMLEIANVADIAGLARGLYKDHPDLAERFQSISKGLEFFKYLRNKYIGHFVPELTVQTFEWLPQANMLLGSTETKAQGALSWFALETAINTYVDPASGHKIFEGDTDLVYPPDLTRFLNFLGETALGAIAYTRSLIDVTKGYIVVPDFEKDWMKLAKKAGQIDFAYLTKGNGR